MAFIIAAYAPSVMELRMGERWRSGVSAERRR